MREAQAKAELTALQGRKVNLEGKIAWIRESIQEDIRLARKPDPNGQLEFHQSQYQIVNNRIKLLEQPYNYVAEGIARGFYDAMVDAKISVTSEKVQTWDNLTEAERRAYTKAFNR